MFEDKVTTIFQSIRNCSPSDRTYSSQGLLVLTLCCRMNYKDVTHWAP